MKNTRKRNAVIHPLGLVVICIEIALLFCSTAVEAKAQKCKLQPRNKQALLQPPVNSGIPGDGVLNQSTIATATSSGHSSGKSTATHTSGGNNSPSSTQAASTNLPPLPPFNYGSDKIRGVNLGGWLVLEPWITPSVFKSTGNNNIVDEFTLGQFLDQDTAQSILTNHWETWITEDDFVQISAAGLNHVRIPIGYWSIPLPSSATNTSTSVSPYTSGAWPYLLKALTWAQKHNVYVIVDLHGAPGSQNGYDNSGQRTNNPVWALNQQNVTRTIDTLRWMAGQIGDQISMLELLNEAAGFEGSNWASVIRQFWQDAYEAVREAAGDDIKVMIGDAFLGVNSWTNFLDAPQAQGVLMDFHEYQIFSDLELDRSFDDHVNFACTYAQSLPSFESSNIWTIVGEWSAAVTDCAQWLNGLGVGARWDGTWFPGPNSVVHGTCSNYTGSSNGWTQDYKNFLRKYWEVQVEVGESVQGWVFWTWKAENADEWSYQKGLQGGWIPQDPTNRLFPNICSS